MHDRGTPHGSPGDQPITGKLIPLPLPANVTLADEGGQNRTRRTSRVWANPAVTTCTKSNPDTRIYLSPPGTGTLLTRCRLQSACSIDSRLNSRIFWPAGLHRR